MIIVIISWYWDATELPSWVSLAWAKLSLAELSEASEIQFAPKFHTDALICWCTPLAIYSLSFICHSIDFFYSNKLDLQLDNLSCFQWLETRFFFAYLDFLSWFLSWFKHSMYLKNCVFSHCIWLNFWNLKLMFKNVSAID